MFVQTSQQSLTFTFASTYWYFGNWIEGYLQNALWLRRTDDLPYSTSSWVAEVAILFLVGLGCSMVIYGSHDFLCRIHKPLSGNHSPPPPPPPKPQIFSLLLSSFFFTEWIFPHPHQSSGKCLFQKPYSVLHRVVLSLCSVWNFNPQNLLQKYISSSYCVSSLMQHLGATTQASSLVTSSSPLSTFSLSVVSTSMATAFCSFSLILSPWKASRLCRSRSRYSMNSMNSCFSSWRFSIRALTSLDLSCKGDEISILPVCIGKFLHGPFAL